MKQQASAASKQGRFSRSSAFCRAVGDNSALRLSLEGLALLGVSALEAVQLHGSLATRFLSLLGRPLPIILLNAALLLWLNLGLKLLLQKWHISLAVSAVLVTAWSAANYYVLEYHGSPLVFSEFANFGTAMNVLGGYSLAWTGRITLVVLAGLAELLAALVLWALRKRGVRFWVLRDALLTLLAFGGTTLLLWLSLFVWQSPKPRTSSLWTWKEGVTDYGYAAYIVEDVDRSIHSVRRPDYYDPAHLDAFEAPEPVEAPAFRPDIILILNESFYDPADYLAMTTDVDYLEAYHSIPGAVYGRALVPYAFGGTNNTEFELLTSCSFALMTRFAPFNFLNLKLNDTNPARYLKALGYRSAALHCEPGSNYNRNNAYPAMGFDEVVLGNENFLCRSYGNRRNLDEDNYQDMLRVGETLGDGPRFLYLLTYQNHGGWESNGASLDTVHVQEDFGELSDDLNEYLTSVRMSGDAFAALTEQLAASERPTIVCMLGDHSPSLLQSMTPDASLSDLQKALLPRLVPYVIWSNFDAELSFPTSYASTMDLLPMLYQAAGLPCSGFQKLLLELHAKLPARAHDGYCVYENGWFGWISDSGLTDRLHSYYELEYNALDHGSDYRRDLFVCPVLQPE